MTFRELHLNVKIRLIQNFIGNVVGSMIFPFITVYFSEAIGAKWTGLLVVLSIVISVTAGTYGGHFADKYGRKTVKVYSESARVLLFAVMTFANSPWYHSPWITCTAMLLIGLCDGLNNPASEAMLIDVTTPETRSVVYSIDYWSNNFGLVVGGMAGGFLFRSYKFELFGTLTLLMLASLVVLFLWITETKPEAKPSEKGKQPAGMGASYKSVFRNTVFVTFLLGALFCGSLENIINNYGRVRMDQDIASPQTLFAIGHWALALDGLQLYAFLQSINALIVVLFSVLVRKFVQKFGQSRSLLLGVALCLVGYSVIMVSNLPGLLMISVVIGTIGEVLFVPVRQTILANLAPEHNRGVYMAVAGLTGVGSALLGGISITLGTFVSKWTMLGLFVIIGVLSLVMYARTLRRMAKSSVSPSPHADLSA